MLERLETIPDTAILGLPVGGMKLIDYLPTRVFELTIHSLDIVAAAGLREEPPPGPMQATLYLLSDRALAVGKATEIALAATGRASLPDGFSLV